MEEYVLPLGSSSASSYGFHQAFCLETRREESIPGNSSVLAALELTTDDDYKDIFFTPYSFVSDIPNSGFSYIRAESPHIEHDIISILIRSKVVKSIFVSSLSGDKSIMIYMTLLSTDKKSRFSVYDREMELIKHFNLQINFDFEIIEDCELPDVINSGAKQIYNNAEL